MSDFLSEGSKNYSFFMEIWDLSMSQKSLLQQEKDQTLSICLKLQFNFCELWICCSSRKTVPISDAHPSVVIRPDGPALLQGRNDHLLKCFFLSNMKECFLLSNKYLVSLAFAESFLFTQNYCFGVGVGVPFFFFFYYFLLCILDFWESSGRKDCTCVFVMKTYLILVIYCSCKYQNSVFN